MAFVFRSERQTVLEIGNTPKTIGPGTYETLKTGKIDQSYAPFASTVPRSSANQASFSESTASPGPGSYLNEKASKASAASSNSFVTKTSRFVSENKTIKSTPGPGAYSTPNSFDKVGKPKSQKFDIVPEGENRYSVTWFKVPSAPSIPAPSQSYGYEEGPNGILVQQKAPEAGYQGLGRDTVGPGAYEPKDNFVTHQSRHSDFSKSPYKRESFIGAVKNPGPGDYEPKKESPPRKRPNAIFQSRVPRPSETAAPEGDEPVPGPGSYNMPDTFKRVSVPENVQFFGSTVKRSYDIDPQQYLAPYHLKTPGPGSYLANSASPQKQTVIMLAEKPPFSSSTNRFKGDQKKAALPGPGAYDQYDSSGMLAEVQRKVVGRNGVFGSTSKRETAGREQPKKEAAPPGPGSYDLDNKEGKSQVRRRRNMNAVFASTTSRMTQSAPAAMKSEVPPPGSYEVPNTWDHTLTKPYRQSDVFITASPRLPRRDGTGQGGKLSSAPGPGAYLGNDDSKYKPAHQISSVFSSKTSRFKANKPTSPGPGVYDASHILNPLIKRSFNVTVDSATDFREP